MGSSRDTHVDKSCLLCHFQGLHITLCGFLLQGLLNAVTSSLPRHELCSKPPTQNMICPQVGLGLVHIQHIISRQSSSDQQGSPNSKYSALFKGVEVSSFDFLDSSVSLCCSPVVIFYGAGWAVTRPSMVARREMHATVLRGVMVDTDERLETYFQYRVQSHKWPRLTLWPCDLQIMWI